MAQSQGVQRVQVVLLSLEKTAWFDEMYGSLLTELSAKADIEEVTAAETATALFTRDHKPSIILATDGALARTKFSQQQSEAIRFVENGGTLVFGLGFPSFTRPSEIKSLFQALSLLWEAGEYFRSDFHANGMAQAISTVGISQRYSQKALTLKHVARGDAVYLPSASSRIQSHVFAPDPIDDLTQTPTAFRQHGSGRVGYLGDVNAEEETNKVVLAMCGLLA